MNTSLDDSLQGQISLQNMFDAIKVKKQILIYFLIIINILLSLKTAEIYESIENMTIDDTSKKTILKDFCNVSCSFP